MHTPWNHNCIVKTSNTPPKTSPVIVPASYTSHWEKAMAPHSSTVAQKIPWMEEPGRLQSMGSLRVRHDFTFTFTFTFHFHSLEKEMATHSSVLAWRIPWTEKPGRLQSMGSHRVGHDWSDAATTYLPLYFHHLQATTVLLSIERD